MAQYRLRALKVDATLWRKNGDHPDDDVQVSWGETGTKFESEGKIVRHFRCRDCDPDDRCEYCGRRMGDHGWVKTRYGGKLMCPGMVIVTDSDDIHDVVGYGDFERKYEPVE